MAQIELPEMAKEILGPEAGIGSGIAVALGAGGRRWAGEAGGPVRVELDPVTMVHFRPLPTRGFYAAERNGPSDKPGGSAAKEAALLLRPMPPPCPPPG